MSDQQRTPDEATSEAERDARSQEALVAYARRLGPDPSLAEVSDSDLEGRVRAGAAALAATCAWLELLGELVIRGGWAEQGPGVPPSGCHGRWGSDHPRPASTSCEVQLRCCLLWPH